MSLATLISVLSEQKQSRINSDSRSPALPEPPEPRAERPRLFAKIGDDDRKMDDRKIGTIDLF
jgi:hypothetical protein